LTCCVAMTACDPTRSNSKGPARKFSPFSLSLCCCDDSFLVTRRRCGRCRALRTLVKSRRLLFHAGNVSARREDTSQFSKNNFFLKNLFPRLTATTPMLILNSRRRLFLTEPSSFLLQNAAGWNALVRCPLAPNSL
jgi:hypothetical protein